ncbi:MAG: sulfate/molybdate ABC transporter ATP-binding protein [Clostridium sp.]
MGIDILNLNKNYGNFQALKDINLSIKSGELVALLGPSGSGKTTLLRIIAGLEGEHEGSILFDGEDNTKTSVQNRNVGFVFQHYALFRHMSVFDNVAFGLNIKKKKDRLPKEEIEKKVLELLDLIKMRDFKDRFPEQLSGGQRQRVALARALAVEPNVLLLDEPFGALDAKVRKDLRRWLRRLHDNYSITSVFVTHDQEEAMDVADRIVIVNKGRIEQIGTPQEVYDNPKNSFVYDFLGNVNVFHGRVRDGKINIGGSEYSIPNGEVKINEGKTYARPHEIHVQKNYEDGLIKAKVSLIRIFGAVVNLEVFRFDTNDYAEVEITRERYNELKLSEEEIVYIVPKFVKVFEDDYVI